MISSFLADYLTTEERRQRDKLRTKEAQAHADKEAKQSISNEILQIELLAIDRYLEHFPTPEAITADIENTITMVEAHEVTGYQKEAASLLQRVKEAVELFKKEHTEETAPRHFPLLETLEAAAQNNFQSYGDFIIDRVINCQLFALMKASGTAAGKVDFMEGVDEDLQVRIFHRLRDHYLELFPDREEEYLQFEEATLKNYQPQRKETPLPILKTRKPGSVAFPIDKINAIKSGIWNAISEEPDGQLSFIFDTSNKKKKGKKDAAVLCAINWDNPDMTITKQLTEWDKRVYIAAGSLGDEVPMTINQIYTMMGNTGDPNATQVKKINESLTKMGAARLYIDNTRERNAGYKYPQFKYDAPLLPFERLEVTHRGKTATAIRLLREPPLISFSRDRGQITTIDLKVLQSPVNKTNSNLRIEDYLLERIAHMKKNRALSRKILLSSLFEACEIKEKKQRQRAPETVKRYLEHYVKQGLISGYMVDANKDITIEL